MVVEVGNGGCIIGVTHHFLPRLQTKGQVMLESDLGSCWGRRRWTFRWRPEKALPVETEGRFQLFTCSDTSSSCCSSSCCQIYSSVRGVRCPIA